MIINRVWEMPNKWTFKIRCIRDLISKYLIYGWVDPFAGKYSPATITNDIEKSRGATYNLDGLEFLKILENEFFDGALFDPPYSVEQCLRKYISKFKGTAGRAEYWAKCKDELARIIRKDGINISFGWDSVGLGKKRGFEIIEILLVCHNDTICTVERKVR